MSAEALARYADSQRALVGTVERHALGAVTAGTIGRYARAIGDDNPLYFDPDAARAAGYANVIAPPNFLSAVVEWGPGRPEHELAPDGTSRGRSDALRVMGAGEDIEIVAPVVAGTEVFAEHEILTVEEKQGRSGPLVFITARHDFFAGDGRALNRNRRTVMVRA